MVMTSIEINALLAEFTIWESMFFSVFEKEIGCGGTRKGGSGSFRYVMGVLGGFGGGRKKHGTGPELLDRVIMYHF